jgi:hypothetical protein
MTGKQWAKEFEAWCAEWQKRLGLLDWAFSFRSERGDGTKVAEVDMDREAREAIFTAYTGGKHSFTPKRIALHEVLHVLLNEMQELASIRGNHEHRDVALEEHRAIERLLNLIIGEERGKYD